MTGFDAKKFSSGVGESSISFERFILLYHRLLIGKAYKCVNLGVVRVAAVDATVEEKLASKYQIKGFPTIKVRLIEFVFHYSRKFNVSS